MPSRTEILNNLLLCNSPVTELLRNLTDYSWDSEEELVTLKASHVDNILSRFLQGELSVKDVETWANAIEGREDIAIDPVNFGLVQDSIFELANPDITVQLTMASAEKLRVKLTMKQAN